VNTMNFDDREVADDKAKDEYNKAVFDNANKFDKLD